MSGHSKWSTIRHKKAKTDAQRGKMFSKLVREIIVAAKTGGSDESMNARLRLAIQKAKDANMPSDNIKKAIQKGAGEGDSSALEEVTFEAYAPLGVALLIEALTDNKNRTLPNIKHILTKGNGSLASRGAVSYLFHQKGYFLFDVGSPEEEIMEIAMSINAEDIDTQDDGSIVVLTNPSDFEAARKAFEEKQIAFTTAELTMVPQTWVSLSQGQAEKILKLIEKIDDDDDVQNVHTNLDIIS